MHVVISEDSHEGWRNFAAVHGCNVTALVEAIGLMFAGLDDPEAKLPPLLRTTIQDARRIAAKRSARRHT